MIEEIIESFEVDKENNLLYSGFYQMYYMQTVSEPEETLKDFKKRKTYSFFMLSYSNIGFSFRWL